MKRIRDWKSSWLPGHTWERLPSMAILLTFLTAHSLIRALRFLQHQLKIELHIKVQNFNWTIKCRNFNHSKKSLRTWHQMIVLLTRLRWKALLLQIYKDERTVSWILLPLLPDPFVTGPQALINLILIKYSKKVNWKRC